MKKKPINMDWSSMTGFGPRAWDRDDEKLSIHTLHHEAEHRIIHRHLKQKADTKTEREAGEQKTGRQD